MVFVVWSWEPGGNLSRLRAMQKLWPHKSPLHLVEVAEGDRTRGLAMAKGLHFPGTMLWDIGGLLARQLAVAGIPSVLVVDRNGQILTDYQRAVTPDWMNGLLGEVAKTAPLNPPSALEP